MVSLLCKWTECFTYLYVYSSFVCTIHASVLAVYLYEHVHMDPYQLVLWFFPAPLAWISFLILAMIAYRKECPKKRTSPMMSSHIVLKDGDGR
jgi:cyanate permease